MTTNTIARGTMVVVNGLSDTHKGRTFTNELAEVQADYGQAYVNVYIESTRTERGTRQLHTVLRTTLTISE